MEKIIAFWKKYKEENWFITLFIILFFPVGLYLMWRYSTWKKEPKWIITAFFILLIIFSPNSNDITAELNGTSDEIAAETNADNDKERQKLDEEKSKIDKIKENLEKEKESIEKEREELDNEREELASETEKLDKEREQIEAAKKEVEKENKAKEENKKDTVSSKEGTKETTQDVKASEKDYEETKEEVESSELTDEEYEAILKPYMTQLTIVGEDLSGFGQELGSAGLTIKAQDLIYSAYFGFELMSEILHQELDGKIIPTEHQSFHNELLDYDANILTFLHSAYEASENEDLTRLSEIDSNASHLVTQSNDLIYLYPF